jgi:hypothetical protein
MNDLPAYLKDLPLHQEPAIQELIITVLKSCRDQGLTELSVGSLMLLLGVSEDNITPEMYEDAIELTPAGIDMALAINEKGSHVIH